MYLFVVFICSVLCGMGMGGGTFLVLYLTLVAGLDQVAAQGINLFFILPAGISSTIVSIKNGFLNFKATAFILLGGSIGIFLGSMLLHQLSGSSLRQIFSFFTIILGLYEFKIALRSIYRKKMNKKINIENTTS